jgi:ABC-2 type transport system permease protein
VLPLRALTVAAFKAYIRNRNALFWNVLVPLAILGIFALLNFGQVQVGVGVVDLAHDQVSGTLISDLKKVPAASVDVASDLQAERKKLEQGKLDLVVVLEPTVAEGAPKVQAYYSQGNAQRSQVALAMINRLLDQASFNAAGVQPKYTLDAHPVQGKTLSYLDFLVPGVIALSIQQTGLFSVAPVFIVLKQRGVIRRLMATPMLIRDFLLSQVATRLVVASIQATLLLTAGIFLFRFHFYGNVLALLAVAVAGGGIFIALGFAISGYAKSEESAGPLTNLVAIPLMFLSGVFFPRSIMPSWLQAITDYSPLTFVSDALRTISLDGASLWAVRWDLLGITTWLVISIAVATRLFRWENTSSGW